MKKQPIFQVDAFTSFLFGGNPAAVCPLKEWLPDDLMQSIAMENNLSETAFLVQEGDYYQIRWFTPNTEVALCGHATLASAFVVFEFLNPAAKQLNFNSQSGELRVTKHNDKLEMDFPALPYTKITPASELIEAIGMHPAEVYESTFDLLVILNNEEDVRNARPELDVIGKWPSRGVILSAPDSHGGVYSRCFYPGCDVPEDPVTGSAHCVIAPYWSERLGKNTIQAIQGLKRQGALLCRVQDNRVFMSGSCKLYLQGHIFYPEVQTQGHLQK
ncbi:epimerase [Legionella geestiana]|uniref:Epimerase n=1 Tax=Legionella geestiana TaxID=45065 RepID=A0A0W0U9E5_9GAMM|nr:PhzF family phenazine biosynthesis protein [Legionella geestiana]KTD04427.1 epimerase [Legionella geestiana]QBS12926.1 PhzF family phenazine biosynthesis protein [Legionella geestiana]QDQ39394.1 PhzF family phenazine biosynthesis protein [Legionella geestiana]STX54579.1 epimerase [Legionella geestiana]